MGQGPRINWFFFFEEWEIHCPWLVTALSMPFWLGKKSCKPCFPIWGPSITFGKIKPKEKSVSYKIAHFAKRWDSPHHKRETFQILIVLKPTTHWKPWANKPITILLNPKMTLFENNSKRPKPAFLLGLLVASYHHRKALLKLLNQILVHSHWGAINLVI